MTSDFLVGRYGKLHLMISDVGWWVGQRGSDIRLAIFEFLLFQFNYLLIQFCPQQFVNQLYYLSDYL